MTNTESCIAYCGWTSEYFAIESGIRQGCPFSPLAFVLALEILAIKIRNCNSIHGIELGGERINNITIQLVKIALYADDITLFLKDEHDLTRVINIFNSFSVFSGLFINHSKSVAMWLGSRKHCAEKFHGFDWKNKIKILGVYFSNDCCASLLKENWDHSIEFMKRIISSWEKRDLSIIGKIHVIKAFLISQVVYFMQAFILPDDILNKINQILFRFLWRKKECNKRAFEKVKRSVLCSDFGMGGLNMIDVKQMQSAFLLQWAIRLCSTGDYEKWSYVPKKLFSNLGNVKLNFFANVKSKRFKGLDLIHSRFWKTVLATWLDSNIDINYDNDKKNKVSCRCFLWNNEHVKYKGNVLFFPEWIKGGIMYVNDMYGPNGILSLDEINTRIGESPSRILEHNVVASAVRQFNSEICNQSIHDGYCENVPPFCGKTMFTCKEFRKMLFSQNRIIPCSFGFWRNKFGVELNGRVWEIPRQCTKETRLRVLQWKLVHNIYPTNIMLFKMKKRDNQNCSYCSEEIDYIEHFFFECPPVKLFWK